MTATLNQGLVTIESALRHLPDTPIATTRDRGWRESRWTSTHTYPASSSRLQRVTII